MSVTMVDVTDSCAELINSANAVFPTVSEPGLPTDLSNRAFCITAGR